MNDNKNEFEYVEGTGHLGQSEFYHLNPNQDMNDQIQQDNMKTLFSNPEVLESVRSGRVQFTKSDGSIYTAEELEAMANRYQGGGRLR